MPCSNLGQWIDRCTPWLEIKSDGMDSGNEAGKGIRERDGKILHRAIIEKSHHFSKSLLQGREIKIVREWMVIVRLATSRPHFFFRYASDEV